MRGSTQLHTVQLPLIDMCTCAMMLSNDEETLARELFLAKATSSTHERHKRLVFLSSAWRCTV